MPRCREKPHHYKLLGKVVVPCRDVMEWARWLEANSTTRVVHQDHIGPLFVSTVFLGLDHNFDPDPDAAPILFETMIFDGNEDNYQTRCSTWDEAEQMHKVAVAVAQERYEQACKALEGTRK